MNLIINAATKTIEIVGRVTIGELEDFINTHNLRDYVLTSTIQTVPYFPVYPTYSTDIPNLQQTTFTNNPI